MRHPVYIPPEYRAQGFICEACKLDLVEFLELCTKTRHRAVDAPNALATALKKVYGQEWYLAMFSFTRRDIGYTIIEESGDEGLRKLFEAKRLGRDQIRKLATEYCDRVAALFGLPVPLDQSGEDTD